MAQRDGMHLFALCALPSPAAAVAFTPPTCGHPLQVCLPLLTLPGGLPLGVSLIGPRGSGAFGLSCAAAAGTSLHFTAVLPPPIAAQPCAKPCPSQRQSQVERVMPCCPLPADEALLALAEAATLAVTRGAAAAANGVHFTPSVCFDMLPPGLDDPKVGGVLLERVVGSGGARGGRRRWRRGGMPRPCLPASPALAVHL